MSHPSVHPVQLRHAQLYGCIVRPRSTVKRRGPAALPLLEDEETNDDELERLRGDVQHLIDRQQVLDCVAFLSRGHDRPAACTTPRRRPTVGAALFDPAPDLADQT
jgi:hypothetical protein